MPEHVPRLLPPELETGVVELDEMHDGLFRLLARIKARCLEANGLPPSLADELLAALHAHYALEARLASEMGLRFGEHAAHHGLMLRAVGKALGEVVAGRANVFGLIRYLEYWFERHIADEDRVFARAPLPVQGRRGEILPAFPKPRPQPRAGAPAP